MTMWDYRVGHVIDELRKMPDESVQMCVTSPPYWGLREYTGEQAVIWGGDPACEHQWGVEQRGRVTGGSTNPHQSKWKTGPLCDSQEPRYFCGKCGAWKGGYGQEPTVDLYVQHTVEILREIRRVLREDGVVFWNIADSRAGSGGTGTSENAISPNPKNNPDYIPVRPPPPSPGLKPKDMCLIPFRVALAAQADGWWVRSDIIWVKPNPMPESVQDRPTKSHEYIFLFSKSRQYYWNADAVREKCVEGAPAGSGRNLRSVWMITFQPYEGAHFATFPPEIPERCIKAASKPGDLVLDPFCGSGTTIEVARDLGRNAVGIDICNQYKKLAVRRANLNVPDILSYGGE